jgi:cyclopentanol dehydrogenase
MRLAGKTAIITGGARGMGAVEARLFAKAGASVVIGDILESEGSEVAADIIASGGHALFVKLDVTSNLDWEKAVAIAVNRFGLLNVLVNNAGISSRAAFESTTIEDWNKVMAVNALGPFIGIKAVLAAMQKAGGGSIINISSTSGIVADKYPRREDTPNAGYYASKAAVTAITKLAAVQFAQFGVRVNSVHPGFIATPLAEESARDPIRMKHFLERIPLGRIGRAEEVAYGVLYLASDESSFVTGAELVIDGGYLAA